MAGGKERTIKFSLLAECLLSTFGIDLRKLLPPGAPGYTLQRMQLFAASQADTFPDPLKSDGWLKWSQAIERFEWAKINPAIDEAIKKALAESSPEDQLPTPPAVPS